MNTIYNFHKVSDLLACAGQPREGQLAGIVDDGYRVVINLGLADGSYALKDEAASITKSGITYHHIPVLFDGPQLEELKLFIELLNKYQEDKVLVHCAANYRASAFVGLYLFSIRQVDETEMEDFVEQIWKPNQIWREFMEEGVNFLSEIIKKSKL